MSDLAGGGRARVGITENIQVKKNLKIKCYSFLNGENKGHYKLCQTIFFLNLPHDVECRRSESPYTAVRSENVGCITILMEAVSVKCHHAP